MNQEEKNNYIKIIRDINFQQDLSDIFIDFVNSYDGTNIEEFKMLMFGLITLMMSDLELQDKAEGFDALVYENEDFKKRLEGIKRDYDKINAGDVPAGPFAGNPPKE